MIPVLFRVEASHAIGTGHLARSVTLASAFVEAGHAVRFLVGADEALVARWLDGRGFSIDRRSVPPHGEDDARWTAAAAQAEGALVVLDGYDFYDHVLAALVARGVRVCAVDDLYQVTGAPFAVLNHNLYGDDARYAHLPARTRRLAGVSFALVRDEFLAARAERSPERAAAGRVLVTMGGSDPVDATPRVLEALEGFPWPGGLEIDVVVGAANPSLPRIEALAVGSRHRVRVWPGTNEMGKLLARADVVVTAGGTTCMEIACVGVPAVVLVIADNQRLVHDAMVQARLAIGLGWHEHLRADAIVSAVEELLTRPTDARAMVDRQRATVDGLGKHRAAAALR